MPYIWCVLAFTTMPGNARAHATDDGCVDCRSSNDDLPLGERGQIIQQVTANTFDGGGNTFLVDFIDDTHDTLRLALAEDIGIEFAGALADEANAYAKFSPFGQHLLENSR